MANARNLSALVQALRGAPGLPIGIPLEAIARHLADAGVIVPSALTEDEAVRIGDHWRQRPANIVVPAFYPGCPVREAGCGTHAYA